MHFLGLAGMPRRVPDYPDAYGPFNTLSTFGAVLSVVASVYFFAVIYTALSSNDSKLRVAYTFVVSLFGKLIDIFYLPFFNIYRAFSVKFLNSVALKQGFINLLLINIIAKERAENDIPFIVDSFYFYKQNAINDLIKVAGKIKYIK